MPERLISPTHRDLIKFATITAAFLEKRFTDIPRGSSVKTFLSGPNRFGWEVKRKLIWLGTHSYLFRSSFRNYIEDRSGKPDVDIIDDFVCQQTTVWSGLGITDMPGLSAIPAQAPPRREGCKVVFLPAKTTKPDI
jgi:hypothetical protein